MSDFVTRLAQRQFGQIETAEPRLLERYAPGSPFKDSHSFDASSEQSAFNIAESPPSRSQRASLIDNALPQNRSRQGAPVEVISQRPAPAKIQAGSEAVHHALSKDSELAARTEKRLSARDQTQQHHVSEFQFTSDQIRPKAADVVGRPLVLAVPPTRMSAPARLAPPHDRVVLTPSPYESSDAGPPVYVTIGRIEVTAQTQPAAAKQTPAARKPAMSLEDYLARRQRRES